VRLCAQYAKTRAECVCHLRVGGACESNNNVLRVGRVLRASELGVMWRVCV